MSLLKKIRKCRKAISPVIATIIIIAVTIAVSVAVAGWMMGLWGTLTRTEACRISPASTFTATGKAFSITVLNTGTGTASIIGMRIAGVTVLESWVTSPTTCFTSPSNTVVAGASTTMVGTLTSAVTYTAGMSYEIHVYTAAGNDYLTSLVAL